MSDLDFPPLDLSQYPKFDVPPPKPPPTRVRTVVYFSSSLIFRQQVTTLFLWRVARDYTELAQYMRKLIENNYEVNEPLRMIVYGPEGHHVPITGYGHGAIYNKQGEIPLWSAFVANAKNVRIGYHRMEISPIEGGDEMPFRSQYVQPNHVFVFYHRATVDDEWIRFIDFQGYDALWTHFQAKMHNPNSGIRISWLSSTLKQFDLIFRIPNDNRNPDHQNPNISFADFSALNVYKIDVYMADEDEDEEGEEEENEE